MNRKAIGVFDSGLGGLSAVKELQKLLPNENIIYFGDTGRMPCQLTPTEFCGIQIEACRNEKSPL